MTKRGPSGVVWLGPKDALEALHSLGSRQRYPKVAARTGAPVASVHKAGCGSCQKPHPPRWRPCAHAIPSRVPPGGPGAPGGLPKRASRRTVEKVGSSYARQFWLCMHLQAAIPHVPLCAGSRDNVVRPVSWKLRWGLSRSRVAHTLPAPTTGISGPVLTFYQPEGGWRSAAGARPAQAAVRGLVCTFNEANLASVARAGTRWGEPGLGLEAPHLRFCRGWATSPTLSSCFTGGRVVESKWPGKPGLPSFLECVFGCGCLRASTEMSQGGTEIAELL
jgi:hypothetical protein